MSAKLQAATTGCLESGLPDLGVIRIKEDHLGHDASIVRTADDYAGTRQYVMHVLYDFELLEHAGSLVRSACFAIWLNMQATSTNLGSQHVLSHSQQISNSASFSISIVRPKPFAP